MPPKLRLDILVSENAVLSQSAIRISPPPYALPRDHTLWAITCVCERVGVGGRVGLAGGALVWRVSRPGELAAVVKGMLPRGGFCTNDLGMASEAWRRSVWRILSGVEVWESESLCCMRLLSVVEHRESSLLAVTRLQEALQPNP